MKELKHLNKYFRKYWFKLFLGIVITIVARVFSLVMPSFVSRSIDTISKLSHGEIVIDVARGQLFEYILYIIGAALMSALFTFLMRQTIINVSRYIEYDLKNEVFDHYQILGQNFYKQNRIGDLMNRISEDVTQVRMYGGPAIMYGIQTLTLFACLIPLMFIKAPTLALYTLLPLPILSVLIYQISKIIHQRSTKVQEFLSTLSVFAQETFSGVTVIKAYGLEGNTQNEVVVLANDGKDISMSLAKVNAWFFPLMILLIGISNLFVIYIGGQQYLNGEISLGLIAEFILYVNMLTWPVAVVGWLTSIVQRAEASQKRINEFLTVQPEIVNQNEEKQEIQGSVEFQNVSFTYPDTGIKALNKISFSVDQGETIAILGKTGSGKSTILDLVARIYNPDSGNIFIDGSPIEKINLDSLRNSIGAVPQDAFLFSDTISNNIRFGDEETTQERIEQMAEYASVHENIEGFKLKYDTVLGERGITLSGGQKQRVSIARALIKEPKIYLFDDCLSAVDTETEEKILNNLKEISDGTTTFIVSHRVSSARHANKILVLEEGRIIQQGTHDELSQTPGFYQQLCEVQLEEKDRP